MICKGVETRSDSFFNSFGGILLKVVDLEGLVHQLYFSYFEVTPFQMRRNQCSHSRNEFFWILGCLENLHNILTGSV